MRADDAPAVHEVALAAFADLARRSGRPDFPPGDLAAAHGRLRHLVGTDPGGAWVAERAGEIAGAALALVREGVWGLSLLVVRPGAQSTGLGRALLERALTLGEGTRGGIILASEDARAMRAYARAGFALHPSVSASGPPRDTPRPEGIVSTCCFTGLPPPFIFSSRWQCSARISLIGVVASPRALPR